MPKHRPVRKNMDLQLNNRTKPRRQAVMDEDAADGLGRAHHEDFLGLEDQSDADSDEEDENPVLDVQGSDSDDDADDMDEEQLTGLEAKLLKQSRIMRQKAALDEDEDEDEEEQEERPAWGTSKKKYYGADNLDFALDSDDEDAPAEEEAEVIRMQKKTAATLQPEDYEQDAEGFEEKEKTFEEIVSRNEEKILSRSKKKPSNIAVEEVKKDITSLSEKEKLDVVLSDAPELVGLLTELREGLDELRNKVQPLVEKVKDGQYATKDGISYLEVKHLLLLSYCQSIVFYLLLKAEGRSVRDHPVIARLVELRFFLEKIRPIDKKLQYQIDKLLKATSEAAAESHGPMEDALKYRPNPDLLVSKLDEQTQVGDGVYRPPMIAPVAMAEDKQPKDEKRRIRAEKETRRRASRSAFMKDIANELEGKPEEVQEVLGNESKEMMREKERLDARAREEEELFARIPLSKVERKKLKKVKQSKSGLMDLLDDFDDGLTDLVGADEDDRGRSQYGPPDDLIKPKKLSQIIAESGRATKKQKVMSGDADILARDDLGERRRKHDMRSVNQVDTNLMSDEDQDFEPEEDEVYKEGKQLAKAKKAAKSAKYDREPSMPSAVEEAEGKRHITNMMEKNRGLVPHRKKLAKNPRKKYKLKHGKAVIRQKGQVRSMRDSGGSYGGEATGVRTNLSRSVRFQS